MWYLDESDECEVVRIMFDSKTVDEIVQDGRLSIDAASRMLSIYVCDSDWENHIKRLYVQTCKKLGEDLAKERVREILSFTILLPAHDKSLRIDYENPGNNLFRWSYFYQIDEKDWFSLLQSVVKQDAEISKNRSRILDLGVIDPIDFQPHCRQAFGWMCEKAESDEYEVPVNKFRRLIMTYGGVLCSYMFENHKRVIDNKVTNWRSGYFFERAIHEVYSLDQILKIKQDELQDINPKWVKSVVMKDD